MPSVCGELRLELASLSGVTDVARHRQDGRAVRFAKLCGGGFELLYSPRDERHVACPRSHSSRAKARPMPDDAPVTSATE